MMLTLAALPLLALDPEHYDALCRVTRHGESRSYQCRLDNAPTRSYWNRLTVTFYGADSAWLEQGTTWDWLRADLTQEGGLLLNAPLWGLIEIAPYDTRLVEQQRQRWTKLTPKAFEIRPQQYRVAGGTMEISETREDSDGLGPTKLWLERYLVSWWRYGNVKPQPVY